MCDEFVCAYHKKHVGDCPCPSVDVWFANGFCPYDTQLNDLVIDFIKNNPYEDDEDD